MTYTQERDEFIARVAKDNLPVYFIRELLAKANTLRRIAELSCSSEAADRDRVPCPGVKRAEDCICEMYSCDCGHSHNDHETDHGSCRKCDCISLVYAHSDVPRIDRQEARIRKALAAKIAKYPCFKLDFQGGFVLRLIVPSGAQFGIPSRGLPASFWERQ